MLGLRYFTTVCNDNEHKVMGQGSSLGQLYNVQNENKDISKSTGWANRLITTVITRSYAADKNQIMQ